MALVPKIVEKLRVKGVEVVVEEGAGLGALIPDAQYVDADAKIGDPWDCDVVVKVAPPTDEEIGRLHRGGVLIGFLAPLSNPEIIGKLTEDERAEQQKRLEEAITGFDVVITTANVPGRKAPTLVTAAAVRGMKPGSVVVDLAGEPVATVS